MDRRSVVVLLLCLSSCRGPNPTLKDLLPVQVQRTWTLRETKALPVEEAPAMIRSLGLKRAISAEYEGNPTLRIRVYEMSSQTVAFEMIQKWPQKDGMAFYKGRYFVVADADRPDRAVVTSFLQSLEAEMKV